MQSLSFNNINDIRFQFNVCRSYQQFGECHNQFCVYLHPQNLHNNQEQEYYNNDEYENSGYNENYDPYNSYLNNENAYNQYQEYPNQYPSQNIQMPFQERNFGNFAQQKVNDTPHKKIVVIKRNNPTRNK
eukprot:TRINITY_DN12940_c0_g1_i1.p1 TRINITY_DN12940_c0_g1~~TRINITY_DN12940_c0_g1_i1.p1  ORF type:complete len:130 (-),score=22.35 TRINITY_DN12940_c0_g1_i1:92-481(-)